MQGISPLNHRWASSSVAGSSALGVFRTFSMDARNGRGLLIAATTLPNTANQPPMINTGTTKDFACRTAPLMCAFMVSSWRKSLQAMCPRLREQKPDEKRVIRTRSPIALDVAELWRHTFEVAPQSAG